MQPEANEAAQGCDVVEVRTTFPARDVAEACGRELLNRRVAACVQIEGPITSVYRWQEAVETSAEYACRCKTTAAQAAACVRAIEGLHPYTTPEILVSMHRASEAYARWVGESVAEPDHAKTRPDP